MGCCCISVPESDEGKLNYTSYLQLSHKQAVFASGGGRQKQAPVSGSSDLEVSARSRTVSLELERSPQGHPGRGR